jgi:predicted secreted acid phosphatase
MRITRTAALTAVAAMTATTAFGAAGAPAHAAGQIGPATGFTMVVKQADGTVPAPADGAAIPNIDSVKSTIRTYYGVHKGPSTLDPTKQANLPNLTDSPYATQVKAIASHLASTLPADPAAGKAVVFDVDSTLLSDYEFEDATNFNYDGTVNAQYVHAGMPAMPGMVSLVKTLADEGYAVFGITGRPWSQAADTVANLTADGFVDGDGDPIFTATNLYTKWDTSATPTGPTQPSYIPACTISPTCNTVEYKAGTRKHIEAATTDGGLGDDIVLNVGDQWSDLEGGAADATQKIPNPTYFLAAADIAGAPATDAAMVPPTTYTMAPDGSSGATVANGDDIPNLDPLRKEIRAYYGADATGTANKTSSPYITQLTSLEAIWTQQISAACRTGAAKVSAAKAALTEANADVAAGTKAVAKDTRVQTRSKNRWKKAHGKAKRAARQHLRDVRQTLHADQAALAKAQRTAAGVTVPPTPAAVFDADDTTLWNYDLEDGVMKFAYNPATSAEWIQDQKFVAVPGMPALAKAVAAAGCTIVGVTGRTSDQQAATIANLTKDGYVDASGRPLFTAANYYTKWVGTATPPAYLDCGDDHACSTIEYKAGTREHLADTGLDVVADLGDQFSDLHGGYADVTYKVPNPTYYLP